MSNVRELSVRNLRVEPITDGVEGWLEVAIPLLRPAIERYERNVTVRDVIEDLIINRSLLWIVFSGDEPIAAITASVVLHPARETLMIEFMGGKHMGLWMEAALNALKDVAKKSKLAAIEADGRAGFGRIAAKNGFTETYRHFEMEIG